MTATSPKDRMRARVFVQARTRVALVAILGFLAAGTSARAGDDPTPDKSAYSLLNPTPDDQLRDFSPDRPSKITGPFTVDAGHLQIESDIGNFTHLSARGMTIDTFEALDPTIKLGILSNVDLEMSLNGEEDVRVVTAGSPRATMHLSGFGDVYFRAKVNLLGDDGGTYAFSLEPYVKVPSATPAALAIGNGVVEGGGLADLQIKLPADFVLQMQGEVDALEGANDTSRHPNFVGIANLAHEVPGIKNLTASAEIFASVSEDRDTPDLYTADFALAYLLGHSTQLDVGTNIGLNHDAPAVQVYAGIAQRF